MENIKRSGIYVSNLSNDEALPPWLIIHMENIEKQQLSAVVGPIFFRFGWLFSKIPRHAIPLPAKNTSTHLTRKILFCCWKEIGFTCQMCQIQSIINIWAWGPWWCVPFPMWQHHETTGEKMSLTDERIYSAHRVSYRTHSSSLHNHGTDPL